MTFKYFLVNILPNDSTLSFKKDEVTYINHDHINIYASEFLNNFSALAGLIDKKINAGGHTHVVFMSGLFFDADNANNALLKNKMCDVIFSLQSHDTLPPPHIKIPQAMYLKNASDLSIFNDDVLSNPAHIISVDCFSWLQSRFSLTHPFIYIYYILHELKICKLPICIMDARQGGLKLPLSPTQRKQLGGYLSRLLQQVPPNHQISVKNDNLLRMVAYLRDNKISMDADNRRLISCFHGYEGWLFLYQGHVSFMQLFSDGNDDMVQEFIFDGGDISPHILWMQHALQIISQHISNAPVKFIDLTAKNGFWAFIFAKITKYQYPQILFSPYGGYYHYLLKNIALNMPKKYHETMMKTVCGSAYAGKNMALFLQKSDEGHYQYEKTAPMADKKSKSEKTLPCYLYNWRDITNGWHDDIKNIVIHVDMRDYDEKYFVQLFKKLPHKDIFLFVTGFDKNSANILSPIQEKMQARMLMRDNQPSFIEGNILLPANICENDGIFFSPSS